MKTIDLAMTWEDRMPMGAMHDPEDEHYPCFTVERSEPLDIPEEGVMTVRYRKTRSTETMDPDGDKHYSCEIEVQSIEKTKAVKQVAEDDMPVKSDRSTEEALDALMENKMKENY